MNDGRPTPEALDAYRRLVDEVAHSVLEESRLPRDEIARILADVGVKPFQFAEAVSRQRDKL